MLRAGGIPDVASVLQIILQTRYDYLGETVDVVVLEGVLDLGHVCQPAR